MVENSEQITEQLRQEARAFEKTGSFQEARKIYQKLSFLLLEKENYPELVLTLEKLDQLKPGQSWVHFNMGFAYEALGEYQKALVFYQKALDFEPDNLRFLWKFWLMLPALEESQEELLYFLQRFKKGLLELGEFLKLDSEEEKQKALEASRFFLPASLIYKGEDVTGLRKSYGELVRRIVKANFEELENRAQPISFHQSTPRRRIRVGYVSHNFKSHADGKTFFGWLKHHNKEDFEIFCYFTGQNSFWNTPSGKKVLDPYTHLYRHYSDHYYYLPGKLEELITQLKKDQLDILVYPTLGTDPATFHAAALRLAPVQCTTWGYSATSGLPTLDYYLSNELAEPAGAQAHYSEKLVKLPGIGVCYPRLDPTGNLMSREDFGLPENAVLYLCWQSYFKFVPRFDYIFPAIASRLPGARFIFQKGPLEKKLELRFQKAFSAFGLKFEDFCLFLNQLNNTGYLSLYNISDIFLDTFSFNGFNTTFDAISCNLPLVTCRGEFMRDRQSAGILTQLGVTGTIAENPGEYIDLAVKLGQDSAWRREVKARMREGEKNLFEDLAPVKALENFYRRVANPTGEGGRDFGGFLDGEFLERY